MSYNNKMKSDNIIKFPSKEERDLRKLGYVIDKIVENDYYEEEDDEVSIAQSFSSALMVHTTYSLENEGYYIDDQLEQDLVTVYNFLYAAILRSIGHQHYLTDQLDSATDDVNQLIEYLKKIEEGDYDTD